MSNLEIDFGWLSGAAGKDGAGHTGDWVQRYTEAVSNMDIDSG